MFDHFDPPPALDPGPLATLLDVTLRDGGFEVDFHWPPALFAQVPAVLAPLGIDVVELGYIGGVPLGHGVDLPGVGAYLSPRQVEAARNSAGPRLAAMVHPTALGGDLDLLGYAAAGLDLLRLVYHPDWFDDIARLADQARGQGLKVSVNLALASRYGPGELSVHADRIRAAMDPDVLYIADTCGALLPDQVTTLVREVAQVTTGAIGFHAHDFLSLAYPNALAAAASGATYLDVSLLGLGRGGGNLQAELVLLRHRRTGGWPTAALRPLLACRAELAALAGLPERPLLPAVCGTLNLTPVEEQALVRLAAEEGLDVNEAALWFATAGQAVPLRPDRLRTAWLAQTGEA